MTNSIRWKSLSLPLLNCSFYCISASLHQMTFYIGGNQFRQRPMRDIWKWPHKTVNSNLIHEFTYGSWQWSYIGDICVLLWLYQKFAVEWVGWVSYSLRFWPPFKKQASLSLWWMTLRAKVWLETPCVCPLENGLAKWSSPLLHTVKDDQLWSLLCVLWPTTWITSNLW